MSGRLVRHVAVFSMVLPFVLGFLPRLVFCTGPNGHDQIELLDADCCHRDSPPPVSVGGGERGCGEHCTDTPVIGGPAVITADTVHHGLIGAPFSSVLASSISVPQWRERSRLFSRPDTGTPLALVLHTTIILC